MINMSSYSAMVKNENKIFKPTLKIYRQAVAFFINVALVEWENFSNLEYSNTATHIMEALTHKTKQHPETKYDFDTLFPKFPCYIMRAAIKEAVGRVSSYKSNYARWEATCLWRVVWLAHVRLHCKNMAEATMRVSQVDPDNEDVRCTKYKYTYPTCIFTEHIIRFTDACTARWSAPDQVFPVNSLVVAFYNDVLECGELVSVREEKTNEW